MPLAHTAHITGVRFACNSEQTAETRVLERDDLTPASVSLHRPGPPDPADRSRPPATGPSHHRTDTLTIASRIDAMRHDEAGRVHVFSSLIIVVALFALALMPVLGGDPLARAIGFAALALTVLSYGWLLRASRDPATYHPRMAGVVFLLQGAAAAGAAYYFGVFSPLIAVVAIALYVFALGSSFRCALLAYFHFALGWAALAALVISGIVVDRGLITAASLSPEQQIAIQLCVQLVLLVALLLGRIGRRRTVEALCDLETALHELARREALLHEARFALARAEKGGPGRFTDQQVGSFKLGAIIGRGAMGEIYEAQHTGTGVPAAVKLLHADLLDRAHLDRFVRETRVAASLSSPNLVEVLEVADADQPVPYLAMERLVGHDLWHILRDRPTLPMDEVRHLVAQVSAGLRAMRRAGIVHRDLKPQNLFLAQQDGGAVWKVLDFGVCKYKGEATSLTGGRLVGTPAYMAPEQARGRPLDHRADLYSLAVIVYRCLTGHPAFTGSQIPGVLYEVAHTMPVQPSKLAPLPRDIDAVLAIAMAKNPEDRFDHVGQFARHLSRACRGVLSPRVRYRARALLERYPWRVK